MDKVYIVFGDCGGGCHAEPYIIAVCTSEKEALLQAWTSAFNNWHEEYTVHEWRVNSKSGTAEKTICIQSQQLRKTFVSEVLADIEQDMQRTQSLPDRLLPFTKTL